VNLNEAKKEEFDLDATGNLRGVLLVANELDQTKKRAGGSKKGSTAGETKRPAAEHSEMVNQSEV
jgi:hypothetical protein